MKCSFVALLFLLNVMVSYSKKYIIIIVDSNDNVNSEETNKNVFSDRQSILRPDTEATRSKCDKTRDFKGKCGRGLQKENKIVGGFEVENISAYPYHVRYGFSCGGAILNTRWVISAAHCGQQAYIMVGSIHLDQGRLAYIESYHVHPNYSMPYKRHTFDFDYQLLKLTKELQFSSNVNKINLATQNDLEVGSMVTVTGWGHIKVQGPRATVLRAVKVPIVKKSDCQRVNFPMFRNTLTPRMFCAGYFEGEKDACQGDSGGAATVNGKLAGLVSFGYGCATPKSYGVYADLTKVRSWIQETINLYS